MLKAVHLIEKISTFTSWRNLFKANIGNSMQVKGSCSVILTLKT
jgi:hypothetical protein